MAGKLVQHPRVPTQYNREDVRPLEAKIERISIFCFLQSWDGSGKILSDLRLLRVGLISSLSKLGCKRIASKTVALENPNSFNAGRQLDQWVKHGRGSQEKRIQYSNPQKDRHVKIKSNKNRSQTTFLFLLGHRYHHKRNNIPGEFHGNVQHPEFPPGMLLRVPTWAAPILSVAMRMQPCIGFGTPIVAGQTLRKGWYC